MDGAVTQPMAGEGFAVNAENLAEAFRATAAERAEEVAIRTKGDEFTITWEALRGR
ncbi:MAG: hypothetical protein JWO21_2139, partial [Solirubrobacterales bacterium]|nr:hypothetical protein [Solirubrobacterales bacterium]